LPGLIEDQRRSNILTRLFRDPPEEKKHFHPFFEIFGQIEHLCLQELLPERGLEPLRISPPDPKSGASANFATPAEKQSQQCHQCDECQQFFATD
jgi:hypothetical protein